MNMLSFQELSAHWLSVLLLDVSLKAGLILAAAAIVSAILGMFRASASARHALWSLATVSVLGLPVLALTLPQWKVVIPRHQPAVSTLAEVATDEPNYERSELAWLMQSNAVSPPSEESPSEGPPSVAGAGEDVAVAALSDRPAPTFSSAAMLLAGWIVGAFLTLLPTAIGLVSLWHLRCRSRLASNGRLHAALADWMNQLGMRGSVRLLVSETRAMPMTWGIWQRTILLPESAADWSSDRLRIVLLHELAHVQRRDCLTQLLAQLARAAYWFNPFSWLAVRQLSMLQEQACDDLVLNAGCKAPDYAAHLLAILTECQTPARAASFSPAMAAASKFKQRLLSILQPGQNRRPLSRRILVAASVASLALLSPLSVLRFESAAWAEPVGQATAPAAQPAPVAQPAQAAPGTERALALAELRAKIAEQYVTPVDEQEIAVGAIKGMLGALRDPYSDYLTPEMLAQFEKQVGGSLVGIGAHLENYEGKVRVVTPLQDSPALAAGIQAGDIILQIDGQPASGNELAEAVKRITGAAGTAVRLKIGREAGAEREIAVTRGSIKLPTVKGFRRAADSRWSFLLDPTQKIGYVQIAQFGNTTPQETREALESLQKQGLAALILDLRFCPGGMLESAVAVAKQFLAGGTIVSLTSRNGETKTIKADAGASLGDFPMLVLVNGQTASAGEVVAGALHDNQRAILLGMRTIGKGSVQTLIKLDEGRGAIKLTTAHYQLPSGRNIDRQPGQAAWGIDPDEGYFVPANRAQRKTLLEKRQQREIIAGKDNEEAKHATEVTADWLEQQQADPQLAAALKALTARLKTGQFAPVSKLTAAQREQFIKRDEVEERRETVLSDLAQLDKELAALPKQAVTDNQGK
jgi:carboxyl-terminal processing protease